jgi:hypothetical protein
VRFKQFLEESNQRFDFTQTDVRRLWRDINAVCFNGDLYEPPIYVESNLNHLMSREVAQKIADRFGKVDILGYCDEDPETQEIVLLFNSNMRTARELMAVVAHEMVHQALAEKHGYATMVKMGHGPEFRAYAPAIKKYHNLDLLGPVGD